MAEEAVIDFDNIGLILDGNPVLAEVSFRVFPGEHWVVLGQNGAGKTSLFQLGAARSRPSSGTAVVLGETLGRTDMRKLRQRIGISSGSIAEQFRRDLSVDEVILTGIYGDLAPWWRTYTDADLERAIKLLRLAGAEKLSQRLFSTLSAGERQQVMTARALMSEPRLLLLDEPTSGLDMGARERFLERLEILLGEHPSLALVMITHRLEDVPRSTTHALVLKRGKIVALGSANEVLTGKTLSEAFDIPLEVDKHSGRYRGFVTSLDTS